MDLYLLRHGEAEPRSASVEETERALTEKGRDDVRRVVKFAHAKLRPIVIITSPYLRAIQTAEVAAKELGVEQIGESRNLLPEAKPSALWKELRERAEARVLLVGHEPHCSSLVAFLTGGVKNIDIKKGALLRIAMDESRDVPAGVLKWMIVPALVR